MSVCDRQDAVQSSRSLEIKEVGDERLSTSRRMETLRQWAGLSGGVAFRAEDCREASRLLNEVDARVDSSGRAAVRGAPVGVNGWMLAVLLGCLCGEWLLRKRWKLI
jgi:hypothetical protein